jgi:phospholipid transport system substrate-binding protein
MILHQAAAAFMLMLSTASPASTSPASTAEAPLQELRSRVDRAIQVLNDPAFKGPGKVSERRIRVRKIADEIFDYAEMAKRSLAVHWQQLQPGDRERFVRSFSDLLDRAYFEKIDSYNGEKVRYLEPKIQGTQATVPTRIVTEKGTDIPVEYRMHRDRGRWMVYDVIIEGVSMVSNYRAQFDRVIRTASTEELLRRLEAQVAGQAAPREPRGR